MSLLVYQVHHIVFSDSSIHFLWFRNNRHLPAQLWSPRVQYVNRHCLGGTNNPCSTTSLQCGLSGRVDLSQRTRNAIITSFLDLTLFWRKWHYLRRVSAEMLLINTYWYEKPRANIPSKGISITELWIPIINSWIHIIHDNREYPQFSYGYNCGYPKYNHGYP